MKNYLIFLLIINLFITSCKKNDLKNVSYQYDTVFINHQKFIATFFHNKFSSLYSIEKKDTVIKSQDYFFRLDTLDINDDGFKDLRIFIVSNTPNDCENYFFNHSNKSFVKIENDFSDFTKIKNTPYYYSYERAGCSDDNWVSYLIKIEDFKTTEIAKMIGTGCSSADKKSICIFKIHDKKDSLIANLDYTKNISHIGKKWQFIKTYWENKYIKQNHL